MSYTHPAVCPLWINHSQSFEEKSKWLKSQTETSFTNKGLQGGFKSFDFYFLRQCGAGAGVISDPRVRNCQCAGQTHRQASRCEYLSKALWCMYYSYSHLSLSFCLNGLHHVVYLQMKDYFILNSVYEQLHRCK